MGLKFRDPWTYVCETHKTFIRKKRSESSDVARHSRGGEASGQREVLCSAGAHASQ